MSKFPCKGNTYVSVGLPDVDGPWEQTAECDDVQGCGWRVVMSEVGRPDGSWDTAISSDEFLPLHQQHLDHRASRVVPSDPPSRPRATPDPAAPHTGPDAPYPPDGDR